MDKLLIRKKSDADSISWNLLLLADPSKNKTEEYLKKADIYLAFLDNKFVGEYVLINLSRDVIELKNIAVDETHQRKGIGKKASFRRN